MRNKLLPFQGWRLTFFQGVMAAVFILFAVRMYQLQIVEGPDWQAQADENRLSELPLPAPRGAIYDRSGNFLARNVPAYNVTIVPAALPLDETATLDIYNRLSALVDVPPTIEIARASGRAVRSIEQIVAEGEGTAPYRPVIIAQDIEYRVELQILEERQTLPGVNVDLASVREYPSGALTAHIVGYMGPIPEEEAETLIAQGYNPAFDRIGYEGVEAFLETELAGQRGSILREVDVAGAEIRRFREVAPVAGVNVRLTIDLELQQAAEDALRNRINLINAEAGRIITQSGVVIAMNPQTGEVLAMVSFPSYDNSRFARAIDGEYYLDILADPIRPLVNNAIKGLYPPGSIWKVITALGVLEENVIDPQSELLDFGTLQVPNRYAPNDEAAAQTFVCWIPEGHGRVNMIEAIAWSCDVYFYQVGGGNERVSASLLRPNGLGITNLFRYATASGIGSELGIELPYEVAGRMPDPDWKRRNYGENWSTGDTYNAAFGQGYVLVTPLQLINAVAMIANGGTLYQPTIIDAFIDQDGNVVRDFGPQVLRNVDIDGIPADQTITLLLLEDMIMKGADSLACMCEPDSPFYNSARCDPTNYTNTVDINPDPLVEDLRTYRVHIPLNYNFNGGVCQPVRFARENAPYTPAFVGDENIFIVEEGMRQAVIAEGGTARGANLPYVAVAGKTGTAEYCDNIARPLGLCRFGAWPAHAWFTAYAPYENPQIIVIAFIYNGNEGSRNALPVAVETLEAYCRIQDARGNPVCRPSP
ncbi:MAG: penicillin-binding protein 2 [Chloroflexi bacterium]|nr:penicillin-binding protein 2 [Chloroflexota bacterium]